MNKINITKLEGYLGRIGVFVASACNKTLWRF
jgi:hypothetical protein